MDLYIIAGPNGAGKTTFANKFLPNYASCKNFVNADLIAAGISPFSPEAAATRAGRVMLQQIRLFADRRMSFSFETTLAGRSYLHTITQLKKRGFTVHIFYLWVNNVDVALSRISDRVKKGGHQIPEDVVRRRFDRSFQNFMGEYVPLVDSWYVFDNSESVPSLLAFKRAGKIHIIKSDRCSHLVRSFEKL